MVSTLPVHFTQHGVAGRHIGDGSWFGVVRRLWRSAPGLLSEEYFGIKQAVLE